MILTSQPTIIGTACSRQEMIDWFAALHFAFIPQFCAGHPDSLSFYWDLDQTAAFDAHPANLLRDRNGVILPIDLIVLRANEELAELLGVLV